ncbi:MAG: LiaF domain-containing protein [Acidimicrobiia bacterium]
MNWGRLYIGLIVVVVGVLLLLGQADVLDAGDAIGTWWPLAIVGAGLVSLAANPRHWFVGLVIGLIGVALLFSSLDVFDLWSLIFPAIIILVGVMILFGRSLAPKTEAAEDVNSFNVFSGTQLASHSKEFRGGSITSIFGGAQLDLRDAMPAPGASVDILAAFGGVEIRVPDGWHVDTRGLPIFGGIENVTAKEQLGPDAPTLTIHATALFGGIEIKH